MLNYLEIALIILIVTIFLQFIIYRILTYHKKIASLLGLKSMLLVMLIFLIGYNLKNISIVNKDILLLITFSYVCFSMSILFTSFLWEDIYSNNEIVDNEIKLNPINELIYIFKLLKSSKGTPIFKYNIDLILIWFLKSIMIIASSFYIPAIIAFTIYYLF